VAPAARIRPVEARDLADLYRVCLLTGDAGADASALYADPNLLGDVYAAPYAVLAPECAFVAEDAEGVGGYILGALDTAAFEQRLEAEWRPKVRARAPAPTGDPASWSADQQLAWLIHNPRPTPPRITGPYPSHLHIDLLPRLQGRGLGKAMMDAWLERTREMGSPGVHLGVAAANHRAIRFYRTYGFKTFQWPTPRPDAGGIYFVMKL
jgi:ribosomal protein S18 acetylase RimI-like enzyme